MIDATQLALWDEPNDETAPRGLPTEGTPLEDFPITCTLPFRWANGDTSDDAAQRMLSHVQGRAHYLYSWEYIERHLVSYYVSVESAWIENGEVWGKCLLWPEGKYVDALRTGTVAELDEEEDDAA